MIRVNPSNFASRLTWRWSAIQSPTAEYLSEWRADVEGFSPRNVVEACVLNAPVRDDTQEVQ
jgi:hypothetical protein